MLFFLSFKELKLIPPPSSGQEKKIRLNLSQFQPPAPKPVPPQPKPQPPVVPPKPVEKPVIKEKIKPKQPTPVAKKKVVKKEKGLQVTQKSKEDNNVTKVVKKEPKKSEKKKIAKTKPKKVVKKKRIVRKKPLPTSFHLPKHSKDRLANALMGSSRSAKRSRTPDRSSADRMIRQLYGKEFYSYTKTQQKFIRNNLSEIYRITQNTLYMNGYPDVAVRTGQQGVNVVSFYLHPNGDISNLRLIKPMGYEALDQNTIAVIQIAYKDYPRPKTKTKIVFYVNYKLY